MIGFGGLVEALSVQYLYMLKLEGISYDTPITSALIADVATILPRGDIQGGYLEVASGLPYEMYALCRVNGVDFLAKGIVFSAFEFLATQDRWTDEMWHEKLGIVEDPQYSHWHVNSENYQEIRDLHMDYYNEFSTGEPNRVTNDYEVEVKGWPRTKK